MMLVSIVLIALAIFIPIRLSAEGVRLRVVMVSAVAIAMIGLMMFLSAMNAATPEAIAAGDPGRLGKVGILFFLAGAVSAFCAVVLAFLRAIRGKP